MNNRTSCFLGRLHEFAQLQLDRKIDFLLSDEFLALPTSQRLRFRMAMADATASLGRHTLAVLRVEGVSLENHLPELFGRFNALERVAAEVGAPSCVGGYDRFAGSLLPNG